MVTKSFATSKTQGPFFNIVNSIFENLILIQKVIIDCSKLYESNLLLIFQINHHNPAELEEYENEKKLIQVFHKEGNKDSALMLMKVNTQLDKLTGLISDLLDVTKIESGKLAFYEDYFDFNKLVDEVIQDIQLTAQKHKLVKKLDTTTLVFGDRDRIGQVITNFLTNAVKYSPQSKEIHIHTHRTPEAITLSVSDFGIGIPKESLDRVFERFFRVKSAKGNTFPGIGLGLFISSQIIKRQHGKIWVESEMGRGSTFSFSLPLHKKTKQKS